MASLPLLAAAIFFHMLAIDSFGKSWEFPPWLRIVGTFSFIFLAWLSLNFAKPGIDKFVARAVIWLLVLGPSLIYYMQQKRAEAALINFRRVTGYVVSVSKERYHRTNLYHDVKYEYLVDKVRYEGTCEIGGKKRFYGGFPITLRVSVEKPAISACEGE